MRLTVAAGILTGFAAVGAATPADQVVKPSHTEGHAKAVSTHLPSVKGDWHIGCDSSNHCSYHQGDGAVTGAAGPLAARQPLDCERCEEPGSCTDCYFTCHGCEHYQCSDPVVDVPLCVEIPNELADELRNESTASVTTTAYKTVHGTTTDTVYMVPTSLGGSVSTSAVTVSPTPSSSRGSQVTVWVDPPMPSTTVWIYPTAAIESFVHTMTILPESQYKVARRNEPVATAFADSMPVRRNVAFTQSQCAPCGALTCPLCYDDCPSCPHYMCDDLANHLTVCVSLHAEWEPPTFEISASGSGPETTTVVAMPPIRTETVTQTIWNLPSTIVSAVPMPSTQTITIYPPVTVTAVPASTVYVTAVPASTVYVTAVPASTVYVNPPVRSTSTVFISPPQPSTVYVYPSTTAHRVFEIPLTQTTTITRTIRQTRATAAPLSRRGATAQTCTPCEGNPNCDMCTFVCNDCEHLVCTNDDTPGQNICVEFDLDRFTTEIRDAHMASNETLGQATSLLVRDGGSYLASFKSDSQAADYERTDDVQPPVSNGPSPYFEFNDADCVECGQGEDCDCDWQFQCGLKKRCFYNGARDVVQLCYELGQKCHV